MNITSLIHINELYYPSEYADIINGIIFGKRFPHGSYLYQNLKEVGLAHIVVFSGTNITFITGYLLSIFSMFSKKVAIVLTSIFLIFFVSLLPHEAPVIRATIFSILTLVSILIGRKTIGIYLLLITALVMVLIKTDWLTDISFQLSFAGCLGIMCFIRNSTGGSFKDYIMNNLKVTLAAEVFIVPLTFLHFKTISLVSPLSNILIAWTIEPLMVLGVMSVGVGMISYPLGYVLSFPVLGILNYFITVVIYLSHFPYSSIHF